MFHACEGRANNKAATDAPGARELARWSYIVSTVGIVFGIVAWIYFYIHYKSQWAENSLH